MSIETRRAAISSLIASAGSTIFTVTFYKKDGSERVMQIQLPAIKKLLKGDAASDSAKQAVATRKENHPELMAVYDLGKGAIRSINLDTVTAININGFKTQWPLI
jgi:hypothetical protein